MRQEADKVRSDAAKAGWVFTQVSTLANRVEALTAMQVYIQDQSIHIEDRIAKLDMIVTAVGMPWGRGRTNPIWDELYTSWRGLSQWWKMFKSQRYVFTQYLVKVQQLEKTGTQENKDDKTGTVTVVDKLEWVERTLNPITVIRLEDQDPTKIKIVEVIEIKGSGRQDPDPAFTESQIEKFIKDFGDIVIIETGLLIMNYAWDELDITPSTIIALSGMMGVPPPKEGQGGSKPTP